MVVDVTIAWDTFVKENRTAVMPGWFSKILVVCFVMFSYLYNYINFGVYCNNRCKFQCQYENSIYICKRCYRNGNEVEVTRQYQEEDQYSWYSLAKNAWSGYIINCPHCGEIYRSRQYWYGNNSEDIAIRKRITHVWNMVNIKILKKDFYIFGI